MKLIKHYKKSENFIAFEEWMNYYGKLISVFIHCDNKLVDKKYLFSVVDFLSKQREFEEITQGVEKNQLADFIVLSVDQFSEDYFNSSFYDFPCEKVAEAREKIGTIVSEIFNEKKSSIIPIKIKSDTWSDWHKFWGLSWSYFILSPEDGTLWFLQYGTDS